MRLFITGLAAALTLAWVTPSHASQLASTRYPSCADLLAKYPNGVAESKVRARAAQREGFARPHVSSTLYQTNSARLDRDKDGVMCEQSR